MVKCKNKKALIPSIKAIVSIWNSLPSLIQLSPLGNFAPHILGQKWANFVKHYKCREEPKDEKRPKHTWASA